MNEPTYFNTKKGAKSNKMTQKLGQESRNRHKFLTYLYWLLAQEVCVQMWQKGRKGVESGSSTMEKKALSSQAILCTISQASLALVYWKFLSQYKFQSCDWLVFVMSNNFLKTAHQMQLAKRKSMACMVSLTLKVMFLVGLLLFGSIKKK